MTRHFSRIFKKTKSFFGVFNKALPCALCFVTKENKKRARSAGDHAL